MLPKLVAFEIFFGPTSVHHLIKFNLLLSLLAPY